jgi:hypothetical protein
MTSLELEDLFELEDSFEGLRANIFPLLELAIPGFHLYVRRPKMTVVPFSNNVMY